MEQTNSIWSRGSPAEPGHLLHLTTRTFIVAEPVASADSLAVTGRSAVLDRTAEVPGLGAGRACLIAKMVPPLQSWCFVGAASAVGVPTFASSSMQSCRTARCLVCCGVPAAEAHSGPGASLVPQGGSNRHTAEPLHRQRQPSLQQCGHIAIVVATSKMPGPCSCLLGAVRSRPTWL